MKSQFKCICLNAYGLNKTPFTYGIASPYTALSKLSKRQFLAPSITPVYIEAARRLMVLFIIQFKRVNTTVVIIASNAQKKKY